jgi:hypothetical protein
LLIVQQVTARHSLAPSIRSVRRESNEDPITPYDSDLPVPCPPTQR